MNHTYQTIRTTSEFANVRDEWNRLLESSPQPSPFLTWEWLLSWWKQYAEGKSDSALAIITERAGDQLTAILPGYVRSGGALRPATYLFLGTQFESTDYLHPIVEPGREATALHGLLNHLRRDVPNVDLLEFSNVLATDPFLDSLADFARGVGGSHETRPHRVCPYIDLTASAGWDGFLASRSSNMRAKVRRFLRRVDDAGASFGWVQDRAAVRNAVAELFSLHARRFEVKDTKSIFRADLRLPFHSDVSERFFDRDMLRLFQLRANDRTIAALYCFEFGGGLYYFQAGIDPEWEEQNVGLIIIAHAIKYAFERQLRIFDFMRGGEPYKFRWTDTTRHLVVARAGLSAKGRAALSFDRQLSAAKGVIKKLVRPSAPAAQPDRS